MTTNWTLIVLNKALQTRAQRGIDPQFLQQEHPWALSGGISNYLRFDGSLRPQLVKQPQDFYKLQKSPRTLKAISSTK